MSISWDVYVSLSLMMFFEYAVWGAWAPVLAARLLGPLKMSGKQTGWIYTTLPIACIVSPLLSGLVADKYPDTTKWILAGAHLIAAALMFVAVRQKSFAGLFATMLGWSFCYGATMPLINTVLFSHAHDVPTQVKVFIWAPIAWATVGYSLSGWRILRRVAGDGSDALILSALLGLVMVGCCLMLPKTSVSQRSLFDALEFLKSGNFLLFIVTSLCLAGTMQFYFVGSGQYMIDRGISGKVVPGAMAMAQAAQTLATLFAVGPALEHLGFKWTLVVGAGCWVLLYLCYVLSLPRGVVVVIQVLHGIAYVLFIIVSQIYAESIAGDAFRSSMQGLVFSANFGIGLFLGTQLAGTVMDGNSIDGKFQWPRIWAVPLGITLVGAIVLAALFHAK